MLETQRCGQTRRISKIVGRFILRTRRAIIEVVGAIKS